MFSFHMLTMNWVTDILFERLNLVSTIFYQTFTLSPMLALQKLQKKYFLFHQKSSFHTQDIQMLVFFCFLETKGWRKLCMVPFHNCYIYGTWRSKEMRREVL